MINAIRAVIFSLAVFTISSVSLSADKYKPLPVPDKVRVTSSQPRHVVWSGLSPKEKKLATHLLAAGVAGQSIIFNQNHRHALIVKDLLEVSLSKRYLKQTKNILGAEAFQEYISYAAKFEDLMGPYESSNRKYVLSKVTPEHLNKIFALTHLSASQNAKLEVVKLLTDPEFEVISQPEDADGTGLEVSGGNLYEHGLTGAEVAAAVKAGLKSNVNCRIVRGVEGKLECQVQALNNPKLQPVVKKALTEVVSQLSKALPYASSEHQASQLKYLIKYLKEGNVEDFRQMNIEWVKDGTKSKVDFMMGYVEVYADYLNQIGSWESYVQIVDPETTKLSVALAKNAQGFEDAMPYGIYKKTFPADYSPPALMVYYFRETSAFHSGGYNLPNYDDIRRDVGAKNIIRLDLPGQDTDPTTLKLRRELYEEFALTKNVDAIVKHWTKIRRGIVLLHEIIGHGSGTYDVTRYAAQQDPVGALGSLGSALEEQRADQTALVFGGDDRLVKVGFYADAAEAKTVRNASYDAYLANFLNGVAKQQSLSEAHQRGHWLLVNLLLEKGAVEKVARDGVSAVTNENFVLAVKDYDKYHKVSVDLLAELQRIKAVRDEAALKELFTKHAPLDEIQKPWMQAVIARGKKLAINSGAIEQPWRIHRGQVETFGTLSLEGIAPYYSN